jgi:hypothetical protein
MWGTFPFMHVPFLATTRPKAQENLDLLSIQMSPVHKEQCCHKTTHTWTSAHSPKQHCSDNCSILSRTVNPLSCYWDTAVLNNHSMQLYTTSVQYVSDFSLQIILMGHKSLLL